jgi:hypothetical protein
LKVSPKKAFRVGGLYTNAYVKTLFLLEFVSYEKWDVPSVLCVRAYSNSKIVFLLFVSFYLLGLDYQVQLQTVVELIFICMREGNFKYITLKQYSRQI